MQKLDSFKEEKKNIELFVLKEAASKTQISDPFYIFSLKAVCTKQLKLMF